MAAFVDMIESTYKGARQIAVEETVRQREGEYNEQDYVSQNG
jgi:hypothetical protein